MVRLVLSDEQWSRIEPHCLGKHCLGKPSDPGRSGMNNRMFMEAVLWKARTGSAWRDLPDVFGKWNTIFKRFNDWSAKGVFERIFKALSDEPDMEYAMMDAMIVPVHRYGLRPQKGGHKIRLLAGQREDGQPKF